jgi:hypothetical protein
MLGASTRADNGPDAEARHRAATSDSRDCHSGWTADEGAAHDCAPTWLPTEYQSLDINARKWCIRSRNTRDKTRNDFRNGWGNVRFGHKHNWTRRRQRWPYVYYQRSATLAKLTHGTHRPFHCRFSLGTEFLGLKVGLCFRLAATAIVWTDRFVLAATRFCFARRRRGNRFRRAFRRSYVILPRPSELLGHRETATVARPTFLVSHAAARAIHAGVGPRHVFTGFRNRDRGKTNRHSRLRADQQPGHNDPNRRGAIAEVEKQHKFVRLRLLVGPLSPLCCMPSANQVPMIERCRAIDFDRVAAKGIY